MGINRMDSLPKIDKRGSGQRHPSGGEQKPSTEERRDAERKLWREYKRNPCDLTRNALVLHHWGLIYSVSIKFYAKFGKIVPYTVDELVSDAAVVAIHCIELFDYRRGFQFSTYYTNSFFRNTIRGLLFQGVSKGRQQKRRPVRIGEFEKSIPDLGNRETETVENETGRTVDQLFSILDSQQREVMKRRFFDGNTLQEIGNDLGLSRERIRQVETKALKAIRESLGIDVEGGAK